MLETTTEEAPAWADVKESYDYLLHFALTSDTHIARDIAAILLNSAVQKVSGTEIEVSRLRYLSRPQQAQVLQYLAFVADQGRPPQEDMDALYARWCDMGW